MIATLRRTVAVILIFFSLMAMNAKAKSWRGLTPGRSTQLDAARFAQECQNTNIRCTFRFEDSEVMIIFSGGNIGTGKCEKLQSGTVLAIKIRFTSLQQFEDFRLNNRKVILFNPSTPPNADYKAYYYQEEGFIISAFKGQVYEVVYLPRKRDIRRCPEYYNDPKGFVEMSSIY